MFAGLLIWILWGLILLLIVTSCFRVVLRATTLGRKTPRKALCGGCSYSVEGLSTLTCPECGGDFRRVGIVTLALEVRRRGTYVGALLSHTLMMTMIGLAVSYAIMMIHFYTMFGANFSSQAGSSGFSITSVLKPTSNAYTQVTIDSGTNTNGFPYARIELEKLDGSTWTLEVDLSQQQYRVLDDSGAPTSGYTNLDTDAVEKFLIAAGVSTNGANIAREITSLTVAAYQSNWAYSSFGMQGPPPGFTLVSTTTNTGGTSTSPQATVLTSGLHWVVIAQWINWITVGVLWIGGGIFIVLRRRKLLQTYGSVTPLKKTPDPAPAASSA